MLEVLLIAIFVVVVVFVVFARSFSVELCAAPSAPPARSRPSLHNRLLMATAAQSHGGEEEERGRRHERAPHSECRARRWFYLD